jgi:hypothetical protein
LVFCNVIAGDGSKIDVVSDFMEVVVERNTTGDGDKKFNVWANTACAVLIFDKVRKGSSIVDKESNKNAAINTITFILIVISKLFYFVILYYG